MNGDLLNVKFADGVAQFQEVTVFDPFFPVYFNTVYVHTVLTVQIFDEKTVALHDQTGVFSRYHCIFERNVIFFRPSDRVQPITENSDDIVNGLVYHREPYTLVLLTVQRHTAPGAEKISLSVDMIATVAYMIQDHGGHGEAAGF
jgi:hypothetical protein